MKNYKMMFWKRGIKVIITLILFGLIIRLSSAAIWSQYTPSPTVNVINRIKALDNGYAFATTSAPNYLFFDKNNWSEITSPQTRGIISTNYSLNDFDILDNNRVYIHYRGTGDKDGYSLLVEFNPFTANYTALDEIHTGGGARGDMFVCINGYSACFVWAAVANGSMYMIYPSVYLVTSIHYGGVSYTNTGFINSNKKLITEAWNNGVYQYNGVSWNNVFVGDDIGNADGQSNHYYENNNLQYIGYNLKLYVYNSSSGLYQMYSFNNPKSNGDRIIFKSYGSAMITNTSGSGTYIYTFVPYNMVANYNATRIATVSVEGSINYNVVSGMGWLGGSGGQLWLYNESGLSPSAVYTLTSWVDNNPVNYGTSTNIYATAINSYTGTTATINVSILNSSGTSIYSWQWLNAQSGVEVSNDISGVSWLNFPVGNYTIRMIADWGGGMTATTDDITWFVTSNQAQNTSIINYTWSKGNITISGDITYYAVDSYGNDISYVAALNYSDSKPLILSIDHTNPGNPIISKYEINDSIRTTYYLTSIEAYIDRLYLGTENKLFVFNTTQSGKAGDLVYLDTYDAPAIFSIRNNIKDVAAINDSLAFTCAKGGIFGDTEYDYNHTAGTYGDVSLGINPCSAVYYVPELHQLIVDDGSTTAYLFNTSNYADENVMDAGIPSFLSTNDLMSHSNNYLFILTARNTLTKYDISHPNNVNLIAECRSDTDITSVEAMSNNEIIVGAAGRIMICDFNNSATYYASGGYYIAQTITTLSNSDAVTEISKNSATKFLALSANNIYIFQYGKINQTIEVNQPPTISSIDATDTSPCINQVVYFTVNAADQENDDILYDFYCSGTHGIMGVGSFNNQFSCEYTSSDIGTVTVTAFAKDNVGSTVSTKYQANIQVQNCTSNYSILVEAQDYDTGMIITDALVTLTNDGQTQYTDSNGQAYFDTSSSDPFYITISHPDYFDLPSTRAYANVRNIARLHSKGGGSGSTTTLVITVYDDLNNTVSDALVSATDTSTGENKYATTESNGIGIISNMFASNSLLVSATATNYPAQSQRTSIRTGETKYMSFTLTKTLPAGEYEGSGRNCTNFIDNVWLCGNKRIDATSNNCATNADCITDKCNVYNGLCDSFNWQICDNGAAKVKLSGSYMSFAGMGRTTSCMVRATAFGLLYSAKYNIITYFVLFMIIIIIIIAVVLIRRDKNKGG